jgi:hypothetical protein
MACVASYAHPYSGSAAIRISVAIVLVGITIVLTGIMNRLLTIGNKSQNSQQPVMKGSEKCARIDLNIFILLQNKYHHWPMADYLGRASGLSSHAHSKLPTSNENY